MVIEFSADEMRLHFKLDFSKVDSSNYLQKLIAKAACYLLRLKIDRKNRTNKKERLRDTRYQCGFYYKKKTSCVAR